MIVIGGDDAGAEKVILGLEVEAFWPNLAVFTPPSIFYLAWHLKILRDSKF